eukprot:GSChrysophyteH1.ASY1.ANO1.3319.1 assembled CDS
MSDSDDRLSDQIFVRNLSYNTTDDDLMRAFEPFGPVKRATVSFNKETGSKRGFGFVAYSMAEDAKRAVEELNGTRINGRDIRLELAVKRGVIVKEKPQEGSSGRSDAEKAWHEARKERANRSQTENAPEGEQRIVVPSGVRPGLILVLLGVPQNTKKSELHAAVKKVSRKGEVELVVEGHYLEESIRSLTQPVYRKRHCRLIIRNLSFQATLTNVVDKMGRYGPLVEVTVPNKEGAESTKGKEKHKGFAFVTYLCADDAVAAVTDGSDDDSSKLRICNRTVAVDYCQSKDRYLVVGTEEVGEREDAEEREPAVKEENVGSSKRADIDYSDDSSTESSHSISEDGKTLSDDETSVHDSSTKKNNSDDVSEGRTVFVRGLSLDAQQQDLKHAFKSFGPIEMAVLVKDGATGEPRGSAFVKFSSCLQANACVAAAKLGNGLLIKERPCMVDLAVARDEAERLKDSGKGR